jgi:mono/diheme cytochrome c family protein
VVLGFSAVQLARVDQGVSLAGLNESERLSASVPSRELPGDGTQRAALGYLHANCGSCHRSGTRVFDEQTRLDLWLTLDSLDTLEATPAFASTVGQSTMVGDEPELQLLAPGVPTASALWLRMAARDRRAMPPLASEQVDDEGLELVAAFIEGLAAP